MESTVEIDDFMHDLAVYSYFYGGGNFFRDMRTPKPKSSPPEKVRPAHSPSG
jgi:hypothetical protein